jgi:hypothetical protein
MPLSPYELLERRRVLHEQIAANLDMLIGSVTTKGPRRSGFNLNSRLDGVMRSRHIRKHDLPKVRVMTARYKKLKQLIHKLSALNWQILINPTE